MRKLAILTTIFAAVLIVGPIPAQAKAPSDSAKLIKCSIKSKLSTHFWCARTNIKHGNQLHRFLKNNKKAGTKKSRQAVKQSGHYLIRYGRRHLSIAIGRSRPPHYYGWLCIHSREGAWNSNTGNGYYGGLQAQSGWGGVRFMHLLSPIEQMWVAERAYRKSGYSSAWLRDQWPNTYPPCASYF